MIEILADVCIQSMTWNTLHIYLDAIGQIRKLKGMGVVYNIITEKTAYKTVVASGASEDSYVFWFFNDLRSKNE